MVAISVHLCDLTIKDDHGKRYASCEFLLAFCSIRGTISIGFGPQWHFGRFWWPRGHANRLVWLPTWVSYKFSIETIALKRAVLSYTWMGQTDRPTAALRNAPPLGWLSWRNILILKTQQLNVVIHGMTIVEMTGCWSWLEGRYGACVDPLHGTPWCIDRRPPSCTRDAVSPRTRRHRKYLDSFITYALSALKWWTRRQFQRLKPLRNWGISLLVHV